LLFETSAFAPETCGFERVFSRSPAESPSPRVFSRSPAEKKRPPAEKKLPKPLCILKIFRTFET
jgi:hypothetical protein